MDRQTYVLGLNEKRELIFLIGTQENDYSIYAKKYTNGKNKATKKSFAL